MKWVPPLGRAKISRSCLIDNVCHTFGKPERVELRPQKIEDQVQPQLLVQAQRSEGILDGIGNTPLFDLRRLASDFSDVKIYAKAEWHNPTGSVKDRAAWSIIRAGEANGTLTRHKTILDATSGNAGISYAMIGAALGYKVTVALPKNASLERRRILRAYGVTIVLTDPMDGSDGAIKKARELYAKNPEIFFYANQYDNPANWHAHYSGTGPEIVRQLGRYPDYFIAGIGTGGTLVGTGRFLKELASSTKVIGVQPNSPMHGLEGLKHIPSSIVPGIYDDSIQDDVIEVETERAQAMVRRLAREEGLLVGPSAGAALVAAFDMASRIRQGTIVTVFPDGGEKYLNERFWHDEER